MRNDGSVARSIPAPPGRIDDPEWSPNSKELVLTAIGPGPKARADLYVESADGLQHTQLTHGPGNSTGPVWSPDGSEIAFERLQGAKAEIAVVKADGTGEKILTSGQGKNGGPVWQP